MNFCGAKSVPPTSSIKKKNCQQKLARVFAYTHAYTQIYHRGAHCNPPHQIGLMLPLAYHYHYHTKQLYNRSATVTISIPLPLPYQAALIAITITMVMEMTEVLTLCESGKF